MRRLICACVVRKPPKTGFFASRPIYGYHWIEISHPIQVEFKYPTTLQVTGINSADFSKFFFQNILSGTWSECQTVWIQITADYQSVMICVQTVCKVYQKTTKVAASKESLGRCLTLEHGAQALICSLIKIESKKIYRYNKEINPKLR